MVKIENHAKFLSETGLLFEINRRILHPLGLALYVSVDDDNKIQIGGLQDSRKDPEGIYYNSDQFESGKKRHAKFMEEYGKAAHKTRESLLGYIEQSECELLKPKYEFCLERINYFKTFEDNWDYEGALAPNNELLISASEFCKWLVDNDVFINSIYPHPKGGVEISCKHNSKNFLIPLLNEAKVNVEELKFLIIENNYDKIHSLCKDYIDK